MPEEMAEDRRQSYSLLANGLRGMYQLNWENEGRNPVIDAYSKQKRSTSLRIKILVTDCLIHFWIPA
jgi:hypothetical protein